AVCSASLPTRAGVSCTASPATASAGSARAAACNSARREQVPPRLSTAQPSYVRTSPLTDLLPTDRALRERRLPTHCVDATGDVPVAPFYGAIGPARAAQHGTPVA